MKAVSLYEIISAIFLLTLSVQSSNDYKKNIGIGDVVVTTFLDWTKSDTVPLYNEPGGTIQKKLLCINYNTDDITMIDIFSVNGLDRLWMLCVRLKLLVSLHNLLFSLLLRP